MQPHLSVHQWLQVSPVTREALRLIFGIGSSVGREIKDNEVVSDGTSYHDLDVLTVENMQKFLLSKETDFFELFGQVVYKLEDGPSEIVVPEQMVEPEIAIDPVIPEVVTEDAPIKKERKVRGPNKKK
jgi:hypothetical protein